MHISSLPSDYGIGTMGQAAYDFADYLKKSGQSLWQILPVNPTGFGDSPYSSYSSFAGNPYFIDLDLLEKDGLLQRDEYQWIDWGSNPEQVDYAKIYNGRYPVLRKAAERFLAHPSQDYEDFKKKQGKWLDDYALYMAIKNKHDGKSWLDWDDEYKVYSEKKVKEWAEEFKDEMEFWKALQYFFYKQWDQMHDYVKKQDIQIVGDVPFYMALDSADVWANPDLFLLDEDRNLAYVSGCAPSNPKDEKDEGQVWGNPLYNWPEHKKDDYAWWTERMKHAASLYDIIRLDHFQGFDEFYAVDAKTKDARKGKYLKGPGMELFETFEQNLDNPEIIVEDLGHLTPSLKKLLKDSGYPGMKILEYAFNDRMYEDSAYLPYNYEKNCVAYTGTHDNDTIQGWIENLEATNPGDLQYAKDFMHSYGNNETLGWDMIRTLLASPAATTILQAQDLKALGKWARMNQPATVGTNWAWRLAKGALDDENAKWVRHIVETYGRLPKEKKDEEAEVTVKVKEA